MFYQRIGVGHVQAVGFLPFHQRHGLPASVLAAGRGAGARFERRRIFVPGRRHFIATDFQALYQQVGTRRFSARRKGRAKDIQSRALFSGNQTEVKRFRQLKIRLMLPVIGAHLIQTYPDAGQQHPLFKGQHGQMVAHQGLPIRFVQGFVGQKLGKAAGLIVPAHLGHGQLQSRVAHGNLAVFQFLAHQGMDDQRAQGFAVSAFHIFQGRALQSAQRGGTAVQQRLHGTQMDRFAVDRGHHPLGQTALQAGREQEAAEKQRNEPHRSPRQQDAPHRVNPWLSSISPYNSPAVNLPSSTMVSQCFLFI